MKYLFVHQNFPGQFLHIVRHLVAAQVHDIVFITEDNPNRIAGVRKVLYRMPPGANPNTHRDAQDFEHAMVRSELVRHTALQIKSLGFEPDIIIGHHGWGEMLSLVDIWPGTPLLGYQEFYYHLTGLDVGFDPEFPTDPASYSRVRAKNAVNLLTLTNGGHGQTPTIFQRDTYPHWAHKQMTVLPEGVDLEVCQPRPDVRQAHVKIGNLTIAPHEHLLSFVARDLEPYRGFHIVMRALPRLLREHPNMRAVLVGGDGVSYGARLAEGSWRERLMAEVGDKLDRSRVHFPGKLMYDDYLLLLNRSDAHVYLTYPFVASWSLREALASGCALVVSDTAPVQEFVTHEKTGLMVPFLEPNTLADAVSALLRDAALSNRLRRNARRFAEQTLRMDDYIKNYMTLIRKTMR